jgi:hypothetical protein
MRDILFSYKINIKIKESNMAQSNLARNLPTQDEVVDRINTLETEGLAIKELDQKRDKTRKSWFKEDIKIDGIAYRLGKLMVDLRSVEPEKKQISYELKLQCNIHTFDRRYTSLCEWFFTNYNQVLTWKGKRVFTSIFALRKAYDLDTKKPSNEDSKPSKGKAKGSDSTSNSTEKVSNVGQLSPKEMAIAVANALKDEKSQKDFLYWFKASVEANQTF